MEKRHGKPVDPRQFKQRTLESLEREADRQRQLVDQFQADASRRLETCPICDSQERNVAYANAGVEYAQCDDCRHTYQPVQLTPEQLQSFYEESTEYAATYTDTDQLAYRLENITKPKIDYVRNYTDDSHERWLDVGCGVGTSIKYLEDEGWDAVGLDISEEAVSAADELLDISLCAQTLKQYADDNPDAEFDVVTMFGYLAHVNDPMAELRYVEELLADDGVVGVHVLNFDSVSRYVQQSLNYQPVRHLGWNTINAFTDESVDELFSRVGLTTTAKWYYGLDVYELATALSLTVDGFQDSRLYEYLITELNRFQSAVDEHEMSDYFTAVARLGG